MGCRLAWNGEKLSMRLGNHARMISGEGEQWDSITFLFVDGGWMATPETV